MKKMQNLTWKPPGADGALTRVPVPQRTTLSREDYLGRLEARIARMVREASPDDLELLDRAQAEGLELLELGPDQVAEVLIRDSEALQLAIGSPTFPVPPKEISDDPEEVEAMESVDLGDFLIRLYRNI
jgi:hypothetical protein